MNKIFILAEKIFTVISLLHYLGGPMALILSGGENEGETTITGGYALIQLVFFINYAISLVLLTLRWKNVLYVIKQDRTNTILLGVAILSFFWSAAPSVTSVRVLALIGSSLFGLYFATRYSLKEHLQLLAWTFAIAIGMSLLFVVAIPKYGVMSGLHSGKWRGIFTHKNALGKSMVLSSVVFLSLGLREHKTRFWYWSGLGLSLFLLAISQSSSAIITLLIMIIIFSILRVVRLPYILMVPIIFCLILAGVFANIWLTTNTGSLLSSIGKDTTLTGRTDLWPAVLDKIWERPWLGYGFSGFWGNWASEGGYVWRITAWDPPNAHNGILDVWLDLGLLGLGVYLLGFISSLGRGLAYLRHNSAPEAIWPIIYLLYFWCSNQTESGFLRQNEIYWLLYIVVTLSLIPTRPIIEIGSKLDSASSVDLDRSTPINRDLVRNITAPFYTLIKTKNRSPKPRPKSSKR